MTLYLLILRTNVLGRLSLSRLNFLFWLLCTLPYRSARYIVHTFRGFEEWAGGALRHSLLSYAEYLKAIAVLLSREMTATPNGSGVCDA
jgi:hypothetical protein